MRATLVLAIISIAFVLSACGGSNSEARTLSEEETYPVSQNEEARTLSEAEIARIAEEETYPDSPAEYGNIVANIDELAQIADCIAEVEVLETFITQNKTEHMDPLTQSKVTAISVLKGNMKEDDIFVINEMGGLSEIHGLLIVGAPVLEKGQKAILYLDRLEDDFVIDQETFPFYCRTSTPQAKFIEREGYVFQQGPAEYKFADYTPVQVSEFKAEVTATVQKLATE